MRGSKALKKMGEGPDGSATQPCVSARVERREGLRQRSRGGGKWRLSRVVVDLTRGEGAVASTGP